MRTPLFSEDQPGTVFAIRRYAIHDGPDLRTTVFLKGCPLRCRWCHNPEGMDAGIRMVFMPDRCVGCGECVAICPQHAISFFPRPAALSSAVEYEPPGRPRIPRQDAPEHPPVSAEPEPVLTSSAPLTRDESLCASCGQCAAVCPALAHEATGTRTRVTDVLAVVERDQPFYNGTHGGITISGGEPLAQPEFLLALLRACGERGLHRVVDTSAFAETGLLLRIAEETDLFLIDVKHMDDATHRLWTGVSNARILRNIATLMAAGHIPRLRLPLIPGCNDSETNLRATGAFVAGLARSAQTPSPEPNSPLPELHVLPYHDMARAKYTKLKRPYPGAEIPPCTAQTVRRAVAILQEYGLTVHTGG